MPPKRSPTGSSTTNKGRKSTTATSSSSSPAASSRSSSPAASKKARTTDNTDSTPTHSTSVSPSIPRLPATVTPASIIASYIAGARMTYEEAMRREEKKGRTPPPVIVDIFRKQFPTEKQVVEKWIMKRAKEAREEKRRKSAPAVIKSPIKKKQAKKTRNSIATTAPSASSTSKSSSSTRISASSAASKSATGALASSRKPSTVVKSARSAPASTVPRNVQRTIATPTSRTNGRRRTVPSTATSAAPPVLAKQTSGASNISGRLNVSTLAGASSSSPTTPVTPAAAPSVVAKARPSGTSKSAGSTASSDQASVVVTDKKTPDAAVPTGEEIEEPETPSLTASSVSSSPTESDKKEEKKEETYPWLDMDDSGVCFNFQTEVYLNYTTEAMFGDTDFPSRCQWHSHEEEGPFCTRAEYNEHLAKWHKGRGHWNEEVKMDLIDFGEEITAEERTAVLCSAPSPLRGLLDALKLKPDAQREGGSLWLETACAKWLTDPAPIRKWWEEVGEKEAASRKEEAARRAKLQKEEDRKREKERLTAHRNASSTRNTENRAPVDEEEMWLPNEVNRRFKKLQRGEHLTFEELQTSYVAFH